MIPGYIIIMSFTLRTWKLVFLFCLLPNILYFNKDRHPTILFYFLTVLFVQRIILRGAQIKLDTQHGRHLDFSEKVDKKHCVLRQVIVKLTTCEQGKVKRKKRMTCWRVWDTLESLVDNRGTDSEIFLGKGGASHFVRLECPDGCWRTCIY